MVKASSPHYDGSEIPPLVVVGITETPGASWSVDRLLLIFSSLTVGLHGDSGTD